MTEELRELVAAAIDGELSPVEQRELDAHLAESDEVRSLFARLQSDSIRLKNLSQFPPPSLVARVLAKLPLSEPLPSRRYDRSRQWLAAGIAASFFLAVASGSFLYITRPDSDPQGPQIAKNNPNHSDVLPIDVGPPSPPPAPSPVPPASNNNVAQTQPPSSPEAPAKVDEIPPPRVKGADVFVAPPLRPIPPLDRFIVRVPLLVSMTELERDDTKQNLVEELRRDPAYRIDLFAKDASRGAELFQAASKAANLNVFTDALALDRIKKKHSTSYLAYTECLTPEEVRDLLVKLSEEDAKNPERVFDSLHASPALHSDQTALKELLGTDPGLWKRPAAPKTNEPKPISSGTGDELTKSLTAKPTEKNAVLLSFTPAASRTRPDLSKELKEFLAKRGERKASAVPILIVIRQPNN